MESEDLVVVRYAAASNITFHGKDTLPYTREEWGEMTDDEQNAALAEFLFGLVEVYTED